MAITRATIPGSLFSALISSGTPYVRFFAVGKSTIMWDAENLEADYEGQALREKPGGAFTSVVIRERLVESLDTEVKGGLDVITIGKFMILRDAKSD